MDNAISCKFRATLYSTERLQVAATKVYCTTMDCQISNLPICFAACYKPKPEQYSTLLFIPSFKVEQE